VSAIPEEFMREPADRRESMRPDNVSRQAENEKSRSDGWQWLAVGLLLACWLAEASLYAGPGS
jgi:hypothetical protein